MSTAQPKPSEGQRSSPASGHAPRSPRGPRGVGIGLRSAHFEVIADCQRELDWLEFVPENFVGRGGRYAAVLQACAERWPLVPHGVSLSIGGPDPFDEDYLRELRGLLDRIEASYYSDHLCFASIADAGFYDLLPLPWNEAAAAHIGARARELSAALGRPLALENITYYAKMPGSETSEGAYVERALASAQAGLLLDLNNIFVNAHNHHGDALAMLEAMPLDRVAHVHLAGHVPDGRRLLDSHNAPVADGVWALYRELLTRCGPLPTLIEWDAKIPDLDTVLDQADRARAIMREVCGTLDHEAWKASVA